MHSFCKLGLRPDLRKFVFDVFDKEYAQSIYMLYEKMLKGRRSSKLNVYKS